MRWIAIALVLAGCDKLLGLSPVTYVTPDAPTELVTGDYRYNIAGVGSDGLPATSETPCAADTAMQAFALDGTELPISRSSDGSFSFAVASGQPYRLLMRDSDESTALEYQSTVSPLALRRVFYGRQDGVFAQNPTLLSFYEAGPLGLAGDYSAIAVTGLRANVTSPGVASGTYDWSLTGYGMISEAAHDHAIYEHFQYTMTAPSYYTIVETDSQDIEMVDGMMASLGTLATPDTPVALSQDRCIHLRLNLATELVRLEAASGVSSSALGAWQIYSAPAPTFGPGGLLPLAQAVQSVATDEEFDVVYGSPFTSETDLSYTQIAVQRPLQLPQTFLSLLIEDSETRADIVTPVAGPTCPGNVVDVGTIPLALLGETKVASVVLNSDTQFVSIDRTRPVPFEYTLGAGAMDVAIVTLHEVIAVDANTVAATATVPLRTFVAASPVQIDPALFVRDHYYIFTVTTHKGSPGAAQLDFRTVMFPIANAVSYTTMFRVIN